MTTIRPRVSSVEVTAKDLLIPKFTGGSMGTKYDHRISDALVVLNIAAVPATNEDRVDPQEFYFALNVERACGILAHILGALTEAGVPDDVIKAKVSNNLATIAAMMAQPDDYTDNPTP